MADYHYDAWGVRTAAGPAARACPFGFAGMFQDATTGLYYDNARWYSASQGRFLTRDPSGESGGLNLYAYCGNDPVNEVDPTGLAVAPDGAGSGGMSNEDIVNQLVAIRLRQMSDELTQAVAAQVQQIGALTSHLAELNAQQKQHVINPYAEADIAQTEAALSAATTGWSELSGRQAALEQEISSKGYDACLPKGDGSVIGAPTGGGTGRGDAVFQRGEAGSVQYGRQYLAGADVH